MLLFALLRLRGGRRGSKAKPTGVGVRGEVDVELAAKGCSPGCSGCSFYSFNTGSKLNQPVLVLCGVGTRGNSQKFL